MPHALGKPGRATNEHIQHPAGVSHFCLEREKEMSLIGKLEKMRRDDLRKLARRNKIVVSRTQRATKASLVRRIAEAFTEARATRPKAPDCNDAQYLANMWGTKVIVETPERRQVLRPEAGTRRRESFARWMKRRVG